MEAHTKKIKEMFDKEEMFVLLPKTEEQYNTIEGISRITEAEKWMSRKTVW